MTDEQLNRAIAEHIYGKKIKVHFQGYDAERRFPYFIPSGKPWRTHQIDAKPLPDFLADPACTVMLMERPGFVSLNFISEEYVYEAEFCGEQEHSDNCGARMETRTDKKLGRAVALAYVAAFGLEAK